MILVGLLLFVCIAVATCSDGLILKVLANAKECIGQELDEEDVALFSVAHTSNKEVIASV